MEDSPTVSGLATKVAILCGLAAGLPVAAAGQGELRKSGPQSATVTVPFVGCAADGQAGFRAAPKGSTKAVRLDAAAARRLAYYKAEFAPGVLAPRGWFCYSLYGSGSTTLIVSPEPVDAMSLVSDDWKGAAVQVQLTHGFTSGRFAVASIIARVFPEHRAFVKRVMEEGDFARHFTFSPYPGDQLTYRSDRVVEYRTAPNSEGLGTTTGLKANDDPIEGVVILTGEPPSMVTLSVRLPALLQGDTKQIVEQTKEDAINNPLR